MVVNRVKLMPIQNIGTLLENLVVTEAASVLLDRIDSKLPLGFASGFAMPALSDWRPHSQCVGISSTALGQVSQSDGSSGFVNAMGRCLRYRLCQGPNAALLISVLTTLRHRAVKVWANDIEEGHYGNAIPSLRSISELVQAILPGFSTSVSVSVCDVPYPSSLENLQTTLGEWKHRVSALLGFLDPMRYVRDARRGPYTHPSDHRRWLSLLNECGPALAVHFTGNSDWHSLAAELATLREDLRASGFPFSLEVRRQHYVVSVGAAESEVLDALESRTMTAWREWCERVPEIRSRKLQISRCRDGRAV